MREMQGVFLCSRILSEIM